MNRLAEYYAFLDESGYDSHDEAIINTGLQEVAAGLMNAGDQPLARCAELDRQAIIIRKSFDIVTDNNNRPHPKGLTWMLAGTHTSEDGTVKDVVWPDYNSFTQGDFEYIWQRYETTKNLYLKTEYGLIGYFAQKPQAAKHQSFKEQLCYELTALAEKYLEKAISGETNNYYALDFIRTIQGGVYIAANEKLAQFDTLTDRLFSIHQSWDSSRHDSLRMTLDLPAILLQYPKSKKRIDFRQVLAKNRAVALVRAQNDSWQAIHVADASLRIQEKTKISINFDWIRFKAEQLEKLAEETRSRSGFGALSLYEEVLDLYNRLGDQQKVAEVSKKFQALRGLPGMSPVSQELPSEYVQSIVDEVGRMVREDSPEQIFESLMFGRMFNSLDGIRESEDVLRNDSVLLKMMPMTVFDKYGNPAAHYGVDDEYGSLFWQAYDYNFQIGSQTLRMLFWQAYHARKITFDTTHSFLSNSWLNEPIDRTYDGQPIQVKPIDVVLPPLKQLFAEFDAYHVDEQHKTNLMVVIDSLTLKIEALIRYLFDKAGSVTFKQNSRRGVVQEKNMDELLAELKLDPGDSTGTNSRIYLSEDDRLFIRYVMTEKVGLNLRNRVAHGLLDVHEYYYHAADWIILVFSIIVRLCKYQFEQTYDTDKQKAP